MAAGGTTPGTGGAGVIAAGEGGLPDIMPTITESPAVMVVDGPIAGAAFLSMVAASATTEWPSDRLAHAPSTRRAWASLAETGYRHEPLQRRRKKLLDQLRGSSAAKPGEACRLAPAAARCDARRCVCRGFGGGAQCLHERLFPLLQLHRRKCRQSKQMHAGASFATFEALQGRDLAIQKDQAIAARLIFRIVERGSPVKPGIKTRF